MAGDRIVSHAGAQTAILSTSADLALYGGAAGGGKSFALLMEAVRHVKVPGFGAVIFRRTFPRITAEGALWDQSVEMYSRMGAKPNQTSLLWTFPSGAKIQFAHLQHTTNLQDWHGSQVCLLAFDELCEFDARHFWYLLSRNRSTCGVRPYVRASCNPDSESWVADLIKWWIDPETGYAIQERSGVVRWFARDGDELVWGESPDEIRQLIGPEMRPRSFTFIPARLEDNPTLERTNPEYRANLEALPLVDRERLLGGNWKIRPMAGLIFPRNKWQFCEELPAGARLVRYWDKATTRGGAGARTAGVLVGAVDEGARQRFFVVDAVAGRWADLEREDHIKAIANADRAKYGFNVATIMEREPGSGGKDSARFTMRNLSGFIVYEHVARTKKSSAWRPLASQVQAENVWIVTGPRDLPAPWDYGEFIRELDRLSGDDKTDSRLLKDLGDASAGGFNELTGALESIGRDLICSGAGEVDLPDNRRGMLTDQEISELPGDLGQILKTCRPEANRFRED